MSNCVPRPYETFRLCLLGVDGALRSDDDDDDASSIRVTAILRVVREFESPKELHRARDAGGGCSRRIRKP